MSNQVGKIVAISTVCVCFIIFLACLINFQTDSNNNATNVQNIEMTDEEKAVLEIEKANNCFAENDYQEAMEICNTVVETYPNTSVAQNMNS